MIYIRQADGSQKYVAAGQDDEQNERQRVRDGEAKPLFGTYLKTRRSNEATKGAKGKARSSRGSARSFGLQSDSIDVQQSQPSRPICAQNV